MGDTFLLVGGYVDDSFLGVTDTIYKYEHDSWTELETKLPRRGMENLMAMIVDLDIFPPCSDEEATTQKVTTQEVTTQEATTQETTTITTSVATSLHEGVSHAICVMYWMYNIWKS